MKIQRTSFFAPQTKQTRALVWSQVLVLALFALVPVIGTNRASADQLQARSVTITTSKPSATGVKYKYGFTTATASADRKSVV